MTKKNTRKGAILLSSQTLFVVTALLLYIFQGKRCVCIFIASWHCGITESLKTLNTRFAIFQTNVVISIFMWYIIRTLIAIKPPIIYTSRMYQLYSTFDANVKLNITTYNPDFGES